MKVLVTEKLSEHKYKTPEGYLICVDAVLARTGKQSYMRSELFDTDDQTEVDVDRRPEEVFSPQTLASFENKPITKNHPDEDVNSENIKEYSVGFVRDVHKGYDNGQPVILGTLVIQDEDTIKEIENGEYTQLSCGYNCDVVDEENPQQKCIRGNHIALCEQGRAGNARIVDSKIKKDSNLTEVVKFLKQNLFNFDVYYDKINFDSSEEMRNATELLRKYGYKYDIYNSNSIVVEDNKMKKDTTEYRIVNYNGKWYYEMKQDDGFTKLVGPYISEKEAREYFMKHRPNEKLRDVEPRVDEDKDEFISRFMRETKEEYPDEKQRLAIAYSYWNKKSTKDTVEDYQSTKTSYERIEEMPRSARKWVAETDNKKAGLLAIKNGIEDIINAAEPSIRNELRRRGDKILQDLKTQFRIEDEESTYTEVTKELEKNYDNFVEDDDISSLPDRIEKEKFNELYYKLRDKFENKWNYRVSTYGDKFKIEIEKAVGAAKGTYGPVGGEWKTVKTIYSKDSIKDSKLTLDQIINIYKVLKKNK